MTSFPLEAQIQLGYQTPMVLKGLRPKGAGDHNGIILLITCLKNAIA